MGRIIRKSFEEIEKEWPPERVKAALDSAPIFDDDITEEDILTGRVKHGGTGFASFLEYIRRNNRPVSDDEAAVAVGDRPITAVAVEA